VSRGIVRIRDVVAVAAIRNREDLAVEVLTVYGERRRGILIGGKTFDRDNLEAGGVTFGEGRGYKGECFLYIEVDGKTEKFKVGDLCDFGVLSKRDLLEIIRMKEQINCRMKEKMTRASNLLGR
jgi:hypothetical protein